ncbi:MAG: hypothetical protein B6U69_04060 [Thermofilum sp. ex4484_15]|nr:MAG: hypothetical protein B6U69_04060 [Thermofilum sp. ex4484_15]
MGAKLSKFIIVTSSYDPLRGKVENLVSKVARELGVNYEVREEDWDLLVKYGERDEVGGLDLPQVFAEYEDGSIKHLLTRIPLDERGKLDLSKAEEILRSKLNL